jgi:hypothetical protein
MLDARAGDESWWASLLAAAARVFLGPLPLALVLVAALASQTRDGATQVADAMCGNACYGVDTHVHYLKLATVILALASSLAVARSWTREPSPQRALGTLPVACVLAFGVVAASAPWWGSGSILAIAVLIVAIVSCQAATPAGADDSSRMRAFETVVRLRGVRVAVVVVVVYALFLLAIPQSSPQAIDAILAWSSHPSYVLASVASAVLLSLAVHDSALRLACPVQSIEAVGPAGRNRRESRETVVLRIAGLGVIVLLVVLWLASYVAWYDGAFAVGVIALLTFVSTRETTDLPDASVDVGDDVRHRLAAWLRMIGQIPLVLFTVAVTLALVEAIIGGDWTGTAWLALALLMLVAALLLLERGQRDDAGDAATPPPPMRWPALLQTQWWASLIATVVLADRYVNGLAGIALVLAAGLLGAHLWRRKGWPTPAAETGSWLALRYIGLVPLAALAVGTLVDWPGVGLVVSLAVIASALVLRAVTRKPGAGFMELVDASGGRGLGLPIACGAGIALLLDSLTDIVRTSTIVGTIAAINLAAAAVIAILHTVVVRVDRWRLPSRTPVRRRVPILGILMAWGVVAVVFMPAASHRMLVSARAQAPTPTIDDALDAFFARPVALVRGHPRPILLVASDGGGARASYWTALVLDCIVAARAPEKASSATTCTHDRSSAADEQQARARSILLASGVSGGGVGLAQYAAALVAGNGRLPTSWAEDDAGYDMLRAPMTWGVTHDLVAGLLGLHAPDEQCLQQPETDHGIRCRLVRALTRDRGNILADAIAGEGGRSPLPTVPLRSVTVQPDNDLPVYIDNATLAGGVARVLASPLDLAARLTNNADTNHVCGELIASRTLCNTTPVARVRDLANVLGPQRDMPLFDASTLGARFPVITAPGYVASCGSGCESSSSMSDGGFLENSGLLTIRDLLPDILQRVAGYNRAHPAARYAIYVVELDNHSRRSADTGEIASARVATTALNLTSARDFIEGYARESVVDFVGSACYVRVHPTVNAAGSAPTGWLLSDDAERGLAQSLASGSATNPTLQMLVSWIDGANADRSCIP